MSCIYEIINALLVHIFFTSQTQDQSLPGNETDKVYPSLGQMSALCVCSLYLLHQIP